MVNHAAHEKPREIVAPQGFQQSRCYVWNTLER